MKAILISIRPRHNKNILNEIKTLEIRKKFPKDYVGWVYIYNTKTSKDGVLKLAYIGNKLEFVLSYDKTSKYQGKVVARFWCDKVEEIIDNDDNTNTTKTLNEQEILEKSCLAEDELVNYLPFSSLNDKCEWVLGYAIHITKLEIFNKPKELKEFFVYSHTVSGIGFKGEKKQFEILKPLTNAPQSWCYIEV